MTASTVEISRNEYEGMKETIELLQDSKTVEEIEKGLEELETGDVQNWDEVKKKMNI